MFDFLQRLLGAQANPPPTPPQAPVFTSADQLRAKKNGFRNAEEMMAWARQRNQQSGGTTSQGSVQSGWNGVKMLHPSNLLGYISNTMNDATK